jgi:hypothetical protein
MPKHHSLDLTGRTTNDVIGPPNWRGSGIPAHSPSSKHHSLDLTGKLQRTTNDVIGPWGGSRIPDHSSSSQHHPLDLTGKLQRTTEDPLALGEFSDFYTAAHSLQGIPDIVAVKAFRGSHSRDQEYIEHFVSVSGWLVLYTCC